MSAGAAIVIRNLAWLLTIIIRIWSLCWLSVRSEHCLKRSITDRPSRGTQRDFDSLSPRVRSSLSVVILRHPSHVHSFSRFCGCWQSDVYGESILIVFSLNMPRRPISPLCPSRCMYTHSLYGHLYRAILTRKSASARMSYHSTTVNVSSTGLVYCRLWVLWNDNWPALYVHWSINVNISS